MPPVMVQRTTNRPQVASTAVFINSPHFTARVCRDLDILVDDTRHAKDTSNAAQILIDS